LRRRNLLHVERHELVALAPRDALRVAAISGFFQFSFSFLSFSFLSFCSISVLIRIPCAPLRRAAPCQSQNFQFSLCSQSKPLHETAQLSMCKVMSTLAGTGLRAEKLGFSIYYLLFAKTFNSTHSSTTIK